MRALPTKRWCMLLAICLALLTLSRAPVSAHEDAARIEQLSAGPYLLSVQLDDDPAQVEQPLGVTVQSLPGGAALDGATVTITGVPGLGTNATQTRETTMQPVSGERGSYTGQVSFPVRGAWDLEVRVSGPAGERTASVPLLVAAPEARPVWLGWLIGMSPLAGVVWFVWWNRGYLRRLRAEEVEGLQSRAREADGVARTLGVSRPGLEPGT